MSTHARTVPAPASRAILLLALVVFFPGVLSLPAQEAEPPAPKIVRVAADGSADHKEIQPAIDAASPGTVIRVGPGTYAGPIRIAKRITLEGAGWRTTAIEVKFDASGLMNPEARAEFRKRAAAAKTQEEQTAIRIEFMEKHGPKPALYLPNADGPVIRGFRLTLTGDAPPEGAAMLGWVVAIRGGKATLEDCAVVGSPASGIGIGLGAHAVIRNCLVAGIWSTGIEVVRDLGDGTRARITGCTIRNGHHRCVTLAGVDEKTVVENCAISGSAWHGIRYDDASPVIRGNRIFGNARCGIYASGDTSALVTGNLFFANEMVGVGCWLGSRDTIEKNTFARNRRSGLEVLGASNPTVCANVFFGNGAAIEASHVSGEGPRSRYEGPVKAEANFFWKNTRIGFFGAEKDRPKADTPPKPAEEAARVAASGGNRVEDPGFGNAAAGDFTLAPESPAKKAGAGAGAVPAADSPWPLQAAEAAMLVAQHEEEDDEDAEERYWEARRRAWTWIEDVMQLKDAARREKGLAKIEKALAATDEDTRLAGLVAVCGVGQARFDSKRLRERALEIAKSGPKSIRISAVAALSALGAKDEARKLLEPIVLADPAALDDIGWHTWLRLNKGALTGPLADYVLKRLKGRSSRQLRSLVANLQSVRTLSPALEARLIELALGDDYELSGTIIHFVLDDLDPKSPAVVKALIRIAENPRTGDSQRALWALTSGIGPQSRSLVADFFVGYLAARERAPRERRTALRALARLAEDDQVEDLEAIIANPLSGDTLRKAVQDLLEHLEKREAEPGEKE